jgi:hypothetical protein
MEIVTTVLFLVFKGRVTATTAITVPWSYPFLMVLDDPASLAVILFIPIPFVMWMHIPFWEYDEDERRSSNPLPAMPYQGPER